MLALPGAVLGVILSAIALPLMWGGVSAAAPMRVHLDTSVDWMVLTFAVGAVVLERAGLRLRSGAADLARRRGGAR